MPAREAPRRRKRPAVAKRGERPSVPETPVAHVGAPLDLTEPPHAHIVCRVCGRISPIPLQSTDLWMLTEVAAQRPAGWSVDMIAYSITGACQRCREGPVAP